MLKPKTVRDIVANHDAYWENERPMLKRLKAAYMTQFWTNRPSNGLHTEVAKAYQTVEAYLGSLYARNPAVVVQPDLRGHGNPAVAQAVGNQFLLSVREQIEDATRLALIFPFAAVKLSPVESIDPLRRVACSALPPWEVVVDQGAGSWDQQAYIGHTYTIPLDDARARYGGQLSAYKPRAYSTWLEAGASASPSEVFRGTNAASNRDVRSWVRIVEMYDIQDDRLLIWSPDFANGERFLFKGIKVQVGALPPNPEGMDSEETESFEELEVVTETTGIPFKSASGRPIVPILPLYFSRDPEIPLRGYSLLARIYDQIRELNLMRTYQAQGVRRMARQWLVRPGFLEDDAAAKIQAGYDGEMIEVSLQPGAPLDGNMIPVPNAPIPADILNYAQTVENDIQSAGVNAPFVSGQVTGVTATENRLLQDYTASQLGRMARTRDGLIAGMARTYNIMLSVILGDDAEPLTLPNPVGPTILSAQDLTGDFQIWASDAGSTPLSDQNRRDAIAANIPVLIQLGAPASEILKELVRAYNLPETFMVDAVPAAPAPSAPVAEDPLTMADPLATEFT